VEDKENRLVLLGADGSLDMSLVFAKQLRVELDISGLVDAVNVAETSSNREVWRDGSQGVVDVEDVLGLGVQRVIVNILVVDAIFLASSDTNLHLEPLLHRRSSLEILGGGLDVPVDWLFGKIDHVGAKQGLAVHLEVSFICVKHTIEPGQKLLSTVVGVKNYRDAVSGSNAADVLGTGNGTGDGRGLVGVADALKVVLAITCQSCEKFAPTFPAK
jgi:hypothetical protein